MAKKVLIVLTSADKHEANGKPTGWYLPELAHPYDVLVSKAELTFASPKGGAAPLDPESKDQFSEDKSSTDFLEKHKSLWQNTRKLSEFVGKEGDFDALFYPGGHGPMYDLVGDADSQRIAAEFAAAGKPVAAVCHGPAVFLRVKLPGGKHLLEGREVTGFSNAEEDQAGLTDAMPFLLETELEKVAGKYVKADEPWGEKVVVDGNVITGQNPASAKGVGEAIAKALGV